MSTLDRFSTCRYNRDYYNCAHFVVDVYRHLKGVDISESMKGFLLPVSERKIGLGLRHAFAETNSPVDGDIVLFSGKYRAPHAGIYISGKVFHLTETGACMIPIEVAKIGFKKVRFFRCSGK